jgi:LPXTG-motif cell wall-anchored protein
MGYDKLDESDILLLDINNNNEYKWTTIFDPSLQPSNNKNLPKFTPATIAGTIIGLLFGIILLSFGSYFLYKWNKNRQNQKHIARIVLIPHSCSNC